jgi:predicted Rossmann-fold nucleotide-binding protein
MASVPETTVRPSNSLELLSQREAHDLLVTNAEVFEQFRQCALAVLNTDSHMDDADTMLAAFPDFNIKVEPTSLGLRLRVFNAPATAFVDNAMIRGIQDHLFSALRDIVYIHREISSGHHFDLSSSAGITDAVFRVLRNAAIVRPNLQPNLTVCWGGHAINRPEYDYCKEVGYQLGLRGIDIATGCGLGAMKGPMKGAAIGHAKQQIRDGRYMGISEPGIIASESPNAIVNELVILPDIEKRLEAFVRLAHCIVVFPGGAGTAEEILYLIAIVLHPDNRGTALPFIMTGPESSRGYFETLDRFIRNTLGDDAAACYQIIIDDASGAAREARKGIDEVHRQRRQGKHAYYFNWPLHIDWPLQEPFEPSHSNMASLNLHREQPIHSLAAQLRRAFSGIVAGNVKAQGIASIKQLGPFKLRGDPTIMTELETLLLQFVQQHRMKLTAQYQPCYEIEQCR